MKMLDIVIIMVAWFCLGAIVASHVHECPREPIPSSVIRTAAEIEMEVTAYCPCEKCCGDWADGSFADGSPVGGKAIAADTSIYPFGTEFDVPGYGRAVVKDRGGAIKGDRLDLYFDTHQEALNFGRQNLTVTLCGRNE
jgi:3D (Asp-Asp-Asp) domain-containing protein